MHPAIHGRQLSLHLTHAHRFSLLNPLTKIFHLGKKVNSTSMFSPLSLSSPPAPTSILLPHSPHPLPFIIFFSPSLPAPCPSPLSFLSLPSSSPVSPAGSWSSQPWKGLTVVETARTARSRLAAGPCVPSPGRTRCSSAPPLDLPPVWRYGPQCDASPQTGHCCSDQNIGI